MPQWIFHNPSVHAFTIYPTILLGHWSTTRTSPILDGKSPLDGSLSRINHMDDKSFLGYSSTASLLQPSLGHASLIGPTFTAIYAKRSPIRRRASDTSSRISLDDSDDEDDDDDDDDTSFHSNMDNLHDDYDDDDDDLDFLRQKKKKKNKAKSSSDIDDDSMVGSGSSEAERMLKKAIASLNEMKDAKVETKQPSSKKNKRQKEQLLEEKFAIPDMSNSMEVVDDVMDDNDDENDTESDHDISPSATKKAKKGIKKSKSSKKKVYLPPEDEETLKRNDEDEEDELSLDDTLIKKDRKASKKLKKSKAKPSRPDDELEDTESEKELSSHSVSKDETEDDEDAPPKKLPKKAKKSKSAKAKRSIPDSTTSSSSSDQEWDAMDDKISKKATSTNRKSSDNEEMEIDLPTAAVLHPTHATDVHLDDYSDEDDEMEHNSQIIGNLDEVAERELKMEERLSRLKAEEMLADEFEVDPGSIKQMRRERAKQKKKEKQAFAEAHPEEKPHLRPFRKDPPRYDPRKDEDMMVNDSYKKDFSEEREDAVKSDMQSNSGSMGNKPGEKPKQFVKVKEFADKSDTFENAIQDEQSSMDKSDTIEDGIENKQSTMDKTDTIEEDDQADMDIDEDTSDEIYEGFEETDSDSESTLDDKVRKHRPSRNIRVLKSPQPAYVSLRLDNVGVSFGALQLLKDVSWRVQTGDRIGLVGKNGAGKTTLLRVLAGDLIPNQGDIVKSPSTLTTAILRQEFVDELVGERTLKEEFLQTFEKERQILRELEATQKELEAMSPDEDPEIMQAALDRLQDMHTRVDESKLKALESNVMKMMHLMGFNDDEADDLVSSFSGGWKMRIGLGKVLLRQPNILFLDEPTNHLDLDSVEWLETFLRQQKIPIVMVSHDREFLDRVCTKIVDTEDGACTEYEGDYSRFVKQKKVRMESWKAAYEAQEKKLAADRQWIQKFKTKQPDAVKQREAKIEKFIASAEYVKKPPFTGKPFTFRFPEPPRLSPIVAEVSGLSHAYKNELTNNRLFDKAELLINRGDRIALVGPNGAGKSTLLRLLVGKETPDEGIAHIKGANVITSYFEQNQADVLDLDKTVLETIQSVNSEKPYSELRGLLGRFQFRKDDVGKKVRVLSGGEKARLSLCCMMLQNANFLVLDEPTNHLDIPAKEMLEEAIQNFPGSLLVVSHDRYFISRIANTIVAIENKKLVRYVGDYKSYIDKSDEMKIRTESRYVSGMEGIRPAPVIDLEEIIKPQRNFGGAKNANLVSRKFKGVKNAKRMKY